MTQDRTGELANGNEVNTLATSDTGLVLVDYMLDRQQERIAGSVMNNSSEAYVNVQVSFNTFDVEGQMVGTARDSTSEVQPGDVWQFGIPLEPGSDVSRVEPVGVQGTLRNMTGEGDIELDGQGGEETPPTSEEALRTPSTPN